MKKLVLFVFLLSLNLGAAEFAGVTIPDTKKVHGKDLVLNGIGMRRATFLNVKVYMSPPSLKTLKQF